MRSKVALHAHRSGPDIDNAIRSSSWGGVKVLDDPACLATAEQAGIPVRILRLYQIEQLDAASAISRWRSLDLSHTTHLQLCNELEGGRCYDPTWLGAVIAGLRDGGYRGKFAIGFYPTGTPEIIDQNNHFPQLEPLYPLLRDPDVVLGINAYSGILTYDTRWDEWKDYTCLRYIPILNDLATQGIYPSVIIGESGGDNVEPAETGGGWQTRNWSAGEYLNLLEALDHTDQQTPQVLCRCIFTLGSTDPQWSSYEIGPILPELSIYLTSQRGPTLNDLLDLQWKSYKPDVAVNVQAAIYKDWIAKREAGDRSLGVPTSDEFRIGSTSVQLFTNAVATWTPQTGVVWS